MRAGRELDSTGGNPLPQGDARPIFVKTRRGPVECAIAGDVSIFTHRDLVRARVARFLLEHAPR